MVRPWAGVRVSAWAGSPQRQGLTSALVGSYLVCSARELQYSQVHRSEGGGGEWVSCRDRACLEHSGCGD